MAEELGVNIFTADIIYHLFDQFTAYLKHVKEEEQEAARLEAVFPCVLRIMPTCVFNKKDPIVVGVEIAEGIARIGTPICVPSQVRGSAGATRKRADSRPAGGLGCRSWRRRGRGYPCLDRLAGLKCHRGIPCSRSE